MLLEPGLVQWLELLLVLGQEQELELVLRLELGYLEYQGVCLGRRRPSPPPPPLLSRLSCLLSLRKREGVVPLSCLFRPGVAGDSHGLYVRAGGT